jgi:cytochrome P450
MTVLRPCSTTSVLPKVVVWEGSANRDAQQFSQPESFLVRRAPNSHLSFGHGVHFCLGAHLARVEIKVALREILDTFAAVSLSGPVEWTRSNRHTGIRHLPLCLQRRTG